MSREEFERFERERLKLGLSIVQYCKGRMSNGTYYKWQRIYGTRKSAQRGRPTGSLMPAVVSEPSGKLEIRKGELSILVPIGISSIMLSDLITKLMEA